MRNHSFMACRHCAGSFQATYNSQRYCSFRCTFISGIFIKAADQCWGWIRAKDDNGYGEVRYEGAKARTHRVMWLGANDEIPDGLCVLHACDNPPCCNPAHLFLGTKADNNADKAKKGRSVNTVMLGSKNGQSKLTEKDIAEIRQSSKTQGALAREFGVSQATICNVKQERTWKHVGAE